MMKYATLGVAIAALTAPLAHAQGPYVGEIRQFAANYCPVGWAQANGAMLPISQNQVLFSLLGTTYGGDGTRTFALPNIASPAASQAAPPPAAQLPGGEARVYEHCDLGGWSLPLGLGDHRSTDLRAPYSDNNVSSVRVSPGWQVTLFDGANLDGESVTVTNESCLVARNFNDRTSSIRVTRTAQAVAPAATGGGVSCIATQGAYPARP